MNKKIAFVVPFIAPYRVTFFEKLFNDSHNDWCLLHGHKKEEDGRPQYNKSLSFKNISFKFSFNKIGPYELYYNKGLSRKIKDYNPDIIIMSGNPGVISNIILLIKSKIKNKKIILWVCSWERGNIHGFYKKFKSKITRYYYSQADAYIAYGTHAKRFLIDFGIPEIKIKIAYNGIETDHMSKNEMEILREATLIRSKHTIKNDIVFIYVGGLIEAKKVIQLIDHFNILNKKHLNIKLWIIGDGPLKNKVQLKLEEFANNNIKYFGRIIDGVDSFFAAADCFVLPGAGGLALNQAMYWRKPCICSVADGTEEDLVFEGKTGFYFERNNWNDLQLAMNRFINTPQVKKVEMGNYCHDLIENQSNVNSMVEIFKETVFNV